METFVTFKEKHSFEDRKAESRKILNRYKTSGLIIVEPKDEKLKRIDRSKYLVPWDLTYGQFLCIIRKRLQIGAEESIFMFCDGSLPLHSETIQNLHRRHGDADGFLYFTYAFENAFG